MNTLCAVLAACMLASSSSAGLAGWLTSGARDWGFVQQTGGIRIAAPVEREGRPVLPVEYCVQGTVAITCQPTLMNSGLAVRRIEVKRRDGQLVIRVVMQLVEKGCDTGRLHYASLTRIPAGSYEVYYEAVGDPTKRLGRIEVK